MFPFWTEPVPVLTRWITKTKHNASNTDLSVQMSVNVQRYFPFKCALAPCWCMTHLAADVTLHHWCIGCNLSLLSSKLKQSCIHWCINVNISDILIWVVGFEMSVIFKFSLFFSYPVYNVTVMPNHNLIVVIY